MKREIKFKAWDKENNKMHYDVQDISGMNEVADFSSFERILNVPMENEYGWIEGTRRFEVMQYTGLCDSTKWEELSEEEKKKFLSERNFKTGRKNTVEDWRGREIYEGDILNVIYSDRQGECHHAKNYVLDDLRNTSIIGWLDYANELKIVGNIFENPELIQN